MKKLIISIILTMSLCVSVFGQEKKLLEYGESVEGEITDKDFEVEYLFNANEGDVIAIELSPEDSFGDFSQPSIILLDSEFNVLETVDANISNATLVYEIETSGEHLILATRQNGRAGEKVGAYTLKLDLVTILVDGQEIEDSSSSSFVQYYAVNTDADFDVSYIYKGGDFFPEISINIINEGLFSNNNLESIALATGDRLERSTIGVNVKSTSPHLYIVKIGEKLFDFNFSEKTVEYSIKLTVLDS
jgi:hypothetical protein